VKRGGGLPVELMTEREHCCFVLCILADVIDIVGDRTRLGSKRRSRVAELVDLAHRNLEALRDRLPKGGVG
jgi:hypothetical protein